MFAINPSLRRIVRSLSLVLLVAGWCWFAGSASAIEETNPSLPLVGRPLTERENLRVGANSDGYPFGYADSDGKPTGFAVDLLDAVARVMKFRIERVIRPGLQLRENFKQGDLDLLQDLSQTAERENYAEFSVPFITLQGSIFIRKDDQSIRKPEDFQGRKFTVVGTDSIATQYFRERGIEVESVVVGSVDQGLRLVNEGQADGVYASSLTALSIIDRYGLRNVTMLDFPIPDHDIRHNFAVHKGDAQLLARLNEGLAILHHTGEFDKIYSRWFGRITAPLISRQQVVGYSLLALTIALLAALWALNHQHKLRRKIAVQAAELTVQTVELTRQAAELARGKALLQALYDNIPMAMCVLDVTPAGYHLVSINRQAEPYFGCTAGETTGRMLADFRPVSEWITHMVDLLQRGGTAPGGLREERRLTTVNKRMIFTLVPMATQEPGRVRLCVLAEDITERRNLDDEIAQSRKLRAVGELVGGIAHEFNNLLTPIMLKVGQIEMDWAHDPVLLAETQIVSAAVKRSADLTQRLLTFGRKTDQHAEKVHLSAVVDGCFSLLRLTMDRRIVWEQEVPADLPALYFSVTNLNQIILNLVINARDTLLEKITTHEGDWTPAIRVEAKLLAASQASGTAAASEIIGWQQLSIRDNGMGMSSEVRERIFEPFYTTKDVGKGTGLGLATVWHMVVEVGGRIEVESTLGLGTTFHVYLPMLPIVGTPLAVTEKVKPKIAAVRVLLVEDEEMIAKVVQSALNRAGHTLTRFADGAMAWEHLQAHFDQYDLLLLDVNMPGLSGIELAERVRTAGRYRGRVLIASGRLDADDHERLKAAKIDGVLNKPFAITELLDAVRQSISRPITG